MKMGSKDDFVSELIRRKLFLKVLFLTNHLVCVFFEQLNFYLSGHIQLLYNSVNFLNNKYFIVSFNRVLTENWGTYLSQFETTHILELGTKETNDLWRIVEIAGPVFWHNKK